MKIPTVVLDALKYADITGTHLVLAGPQMDAKLYQRVNEVLEAVGGRWDKTEQAHVFAGDAAVAIAPVLESGTVVTLREKRQDSQFFPTPASVVARLLELAAVTPGMEVLEPSAGTGALATAVAGVGAVVDCVERDPGYAAALTAAGVARDVCVRDFLAVPGEPRYDRVVMNPPFTRGTDIAHVEHALRFLKPGGLLVSVMSWAVTYQTRKTAAFRRLVESRGGMVEAVPAGAFAESGTNVGTVIVTIPATRREGAEPVVWPQLEVPEQPEPVLASPMEILAELKQNLRDAMAEFDELEKLLAEPTRRPVAEPAEVVELPAQRGGQMFFDFGEAS